MKHKATADTPVAKSHTGVIITAIIAAVAGIAIICFNKSITSDGVTTAGGVLFIAAALLNAIISLSRKDADGHRARMTAGVTLALVVSVAAAAFGVCIFIFKETFIPLIPLIFGALVLLGALMILYALAIGVRPAILPGWLYIPPVLMVIAAIVIFSLKTPVSDAMIMIITGSSMCVFGLTVILTTICLDHVHKAEKAKVADTEPRPLDDDK